MIDDVSPKRVPLPIYILLSTLYTVARSATCGGIMIQGDSQRAMVDAIRHAFAAGEAAAGEDLLAEALDAEVPWDLATRAAAEGVAHRCSGTSIKAVTGRHSLSLIAPQRFALRSFRGWLSTWARGGRAGFPAAHALSTARSTRPEAAGRPSASLGTGPALVTAWTPSRVIVACPASSRPSVEREPPAPG